MPNAISVSLKFSQAEIFSDALWREVQPTGKHHRMVKKTTKYYFRQWRDFRGLTQDQLAERANLSTSTISQIETGDQGFREESLVAIAKALDCSPGDLLSVDPNDSGELLDIWEGIVPSARPLVLSVIRVMSDEFLLTSDDEPLRLRFPEEPAAIKKKRRKPGDLTKESK